MKNSSRFELKIDRNLTRSNSGLDGSSASSSTRALNSSQLNSRLMKCSAWKVCSITVGRRSEVGGVALASEAKRSRPVLEWCSGSEASTSASF